MVNIQRVHPIVAAEGRTGLVWWRSDAPVAYPDALAVMEGRVAEIAAGREPSCVWLLEHPPLYTMGTSGQSADVRSARFPVFETGRGGQLTYHGPGQRVVYVMLNLRHYQAEPDLKRYIWQLEGWGIEALARLGVVAERREGRVGLWVVMPDGTEKKIAAIGVRVRHWVAFHGLAINRCPDLSHFEGIVPCGLPQFGVTSLRDLGHDVSAAALDNALMETCPFTGIF